MIDGVVKSSDLLRVEASPATQHTICMVSCLERPQHLVYRNFYLAIPRLLTSTSIFTECNFKISHRLTQTLVFVRLCPCGSVAKD